MCDLSGEPKSMRVLFVTHRFPGAAYRGDQMRARAQILDLARRHEIHLLAGETVDAKGNAFADMRAACASVTMVPRRGIRMATRALLAVPGQRPLQVALFDDPALLRMRDALVATHHIDVVHVQLARLGMLVESSGATPTVIDFVDSLALNFRAQASFASGPRQWIYRMESARLAAFERRLAGLAAASVVSSAIDAAELLPAANCLVAPNGIDPVALPFLDAIDERRDLVFVGNWRYRPNIDGLRWLIDAVLPRVFDADAAVRLRLVGAHAEEMAPWCRTDRIVCVGRVDSVAPELHRAAIALAPLRIGSGQSLKMLEAMACGVPVVTTSRAAQSLSLVDQSALSVADTPEQFAETILALLADRDRRAVQAHRAHDAVRSGFTWSASNRVLESQWLSAART